MIQIKTEKISRHPVNVILPTDYDSNKKYRTIYLQDGGNAAKQALNYIDHLIISRQIEPLILVGITPLDRNEEYTPWPARTPLSGETKSGGQAQAYLQLLVKEIKPFIDAHYATDPAPSHTAIGGCSFGGLISLLASYYYPEVFHDYIILSASFWYEKMDRFLSGEQITLEDHSFQKPQVNRGSQRMYLYVGQQEGIYRQGRQKEMFSYTQKAYSHLVEEGFSDKNLHFETCAKGTHDVLFFSPHFIHALQWLYGKSY
ncbi:MAG TPA: alpha/beta hydrolase-fold protein [Tetragenococcus sp.]|nr:alpha/beta hydrolase-fold protein [Tetragenococcus sp.]